MGTLRTRVYGATGALLLLQLVGTGLALASGWQVHAACERQLALGAQRAELLQLAAAAREAYVHQAHTFIDGDAGHLEHLGETTLAVDNQLVRLESVGLDPSGARASIAASNLWFSTEVVPLARAGSLDRAAARSLHGEAERRAGETHGAIAALLGAVEAAQQAEVAKVARHTTWGWASLAILTLGGFGLGALVATRLAGAVLRPVEALRTAARAFARGEPVRAPETGDAELAELGAAFNAMVEQVHQTEQRRLATERLAVLGQLAGAVAHELQSPLTVILGHPATRTEALRAVREEAEHASRVVHGLLGFARPGEEPPTRVDLAVAAREAVARASVLADPRDVSVRLVAAAPAAVTAPASAVRQVLDNLLRNAIEASTAQGEVELEVGPGPVIEVRDRGPGIPAAVRPRLYEPFATGRREGTGLGLAISQRIARAIHGELSHRDRDGGGTVAVWTVVGA